MRFARSLHAALLVSCVRDIVGTFLRLVQIRGPWSGSCIFRATVCLALLLTIAQHIHIPGHACNAPQVPQFLLEAGYGCTAFPERCGHIGVTQPRRVAAVAAATRIAQELGCTLGSLVGYQVREAIRVLA